MGRKAKPLAAQVELLRKRGMAVDDAEKARNILLEVGFYRMSFYWFPFEKRYPDRMNPKHEFIPGTNFTDALMLYAFDFNLRNIMLKPLERIETAFRTYMIYQVSTRYPDSPAWFADPRVVGKAQASSFERTIYQPMKRNNPEIQLHHRRFHSDRFAPAWKTLEFMTFGTMCNLYESLKSEGLSSDIARHFGIPQPGLFKNYMEIIRGVRNICAHGGILYSYKPPYIRRSPGVNPAGGVPKNLNGVIMVIEHFLGVISSRLLKEFRRDVRQLLRDFTKTPGTTHVLHNISGFHIPSPACP